MLFRSLGTTLANITGAGYNTAYDKAVAQYNADLARQAGAASALGTLGGQEQQAGLANLAAQQQAGATQRDISQQGLTADYGQYLREFNYPQEQLTNLANTMKVLPSYALTATNTYGQMPGAVQSATSGAAGLLGLIEQLQKLKVI